jgi:RNA-directed DNA polymerase
MNDHRKSDKPTVAKKASNKAGATPAAEKLERKGLAEGNSAKQNMSRTLCRENMQSALERVRQAAHKDKALRFTALLHHVYNLDTLRSSFWSLKKDAAAGVDGETWHHYEENLEKLLEDLSARVKRGGYRAKPVRRVFIPKDDGKERPLGVTSLEDKIVQRAFVEVMNAIYEADFLGFSYGYRPGKGQHDCLDALYVGQLTRRINCVLDCDIRAFFDTISHEWLVKFLEHRVADERMIRLVKKWLNAGVLTDGLLSQTKEGTPQGGSASPFLANVYLHYVFDLWAQKWRETKASDDMIIVRWADDIVVGFQNMHDATIFKQELTDRFAKFSLELHPDKTKVIEFGRYAMENARKRDGRPKSFDFLGFTHRCGEKRGNGMFTVIRTTRKKKMRAKLKQVKFELRKRMHHPVPQVGEWLTRVVDGHNRYYGVPMNQGALRSFRGQVIRHWHWTLNRRSQKPSVTWKRMELYIARWIPEAKIHHPYPLQRFGVIPEARARCISSARRDPWRG